jgi:NAD(P)-dependent dehydrogenase (short-subunit alcohol dehydrogenase family)
MNYQDKIAIITGGTGGLGRVIVNRFADEGMKIYVPTLSVENFRSIFDNSGNTINEKEFKLRKIYGLHCNADREEDVKNFINDVLKRENRVDYLVNTVGGYHPKKNVVDMDTELVLKMMKLNFYSTFYFCNQVLRNMINNNYGRIIAIGAMPAVELSTGRFAYSISKSNVINLMQTIALENKDYNITTNVIVPSIIDTKANRESMPNADFNKWVKPEEIANTIIYLLSDDAKSYRGNVIKMYGKV